MTFRMSRLVDATGREVHDPNPIMQEKANIVLVGPNGIGKTMIAKNLAHQAVLRGHTVSFISAAEMPGNF